MKKIFSVLWAVTFVSSLCFAAEVSTPAPTETIIGRIDSIVTGGGKQQITVRQEGGFDEGSVSVFLIAPDTTITGKDGNVTSLNWARGNRASLTYTSSPNGAVRTIRSIKLLPDV